MVPAVQLLVASFIRYIAYVVARISTVSFKAARKTSDWSITLYDYAFGTQMHAIRSQILKARKGGE